MYIPACIFVFTQVLFGCVCNALYFTFIRTFTKTFFYWTWIVFFIIILHLLIYLLNFEWLIAYHFWWPTLDWFFFCRIVFERIDTYGIWNSDVRIGLLWLHTTPDMDKKLPFHIWIFYFSCSRCSRIHFCSFSRNAFLVSFLLFLLHRRT